MIAQAKTCPHCGGTVPAHEQHLRAGYDKIEWPPRPPIVTRVEQHGGQCPHCGQSYVAPVPVGMEPGTPFGASIESLATSLR
jgi:transposase